MSYTPQVLGPRKETLASDTTVVPSDVTNPFTLFDTSYDLELEVGEVLEIDVELNVIGVNNKELLFYLSGQLILETGLYAMGIGCVFKMTVIKTTSSTCSIKAMFDTSDSAGAAPIVESYSELDSSVYLTAASALKIDCVATSGAGEFELSNVRINKIT